MSSFTKSRNETKLLGAELDGPRSPIGPASFVGEVVALEGLMLPDGADAGALPELVLQLIALGHALARGRWGGDVATALDDRDAAVVAALNRLHASSTTRSSVLSTVSAARRTCAISAMILAVSSGGSVVYIPVRLSSLTACLHTTPTSRRTTPRARWRLVRGHRGRWWSRRRRYPDLPAAGCRCHRYGRAHSGGARRAARRDFFLELSSAGHPVRVEGETKRHGAGSPKR